MDFTYEETHDFDDLPIAWSTYEIYPDSGPAPEGAIGRGTVLVVCATNDNLDHGYPTQYATWDLWFESVEDAVRFTGKSRLGVGHRVFVEVDGVRV